ncbi:MAG: thiamine-phosphate kinase [Hyphomicrobiaceae bacterium]
MNSVPEGLGSDDALHGEEAIIQAYLAPLAAGYPGAFGLADDCAAFVPTPGHDLIVKTDPIASGVHFLAEDPPADVAWKALAVNVSDLAAKGAEPRAYLMALSFPEAPKRVWMAAFAEGLGEAQAAFGMHLIGGDTDRRSGPLTISITVFGEVPSGRMVRRGTARPGDVLFVSGSLGEAALGLALLRDPALATQWGVDRTAVRAAERKYRRPQPRLALRDVLRRHASAAMDLSDGLAKDLGRMCRAGGVGAKVRNEAIPRDAVARAAISVDPDRWNEVLAGGDDYELLIAVDASEADTFERAAIAAGRSAPEPFGVTRIGRICRTREIAFLDCDDSPFVLSRTGWDHF